MKNLSFVDIKKSLAENLLLFLGLSFLHTEITSPVWGRITTASEEIIKRNKYLIKGNPFLGEIIRQSKSYMIYGKYF